MVCVCGCSVCFALQLSLCASQHLGSYHDAYHLQILQVTTPYNVYQNPCAHCARTDTVRVPLSCKSCLIVLWLVESEGGQNQAVVQPVSWSLLLLVRWLPNQDLMQWDT